MPKEYMTIINHLESTLDRYGDTYRGHDWTRDADAKICYQVMLDMTLPRSQPATLLDFGCGTSLFYNFMLEQGITGLSYSGLDISPKFIELAQKKYPDITYYQFDILDDDEKLPEFDYIVMNGVFTEKRELSYDQMWDYFCSVVTRVFRHARVGIAFNVMSKQVDWERDDLFHVKIDDVATFLTRELSRKFVIRHDYRLYQYTVYVYR